MTTNQVRSLLRALPAIDAAVDDADRIDRLRLFEELKAAAAAAQALEAVALNRSRRAQESVAGVPRDRQGLGIASEVALAMRTSPHRAQRWLGWAKIVTSEMPSTFAALQAGRTTQWRATLMARETIFLSREDRLLVDAELGPQLETMGDRRVEGSARAMACRLDPRGAAERASNASKDRHIGIRPAPDTMCRLTGLLPVADGVAAYAALVKTADTLIAAGDRRGRGQLMADTLVERVTGQAVCGDVAVEVNLIMTDRTLINSGEGRDEAAHLDGYGPIPADLARDLALRGNGDRWLRRLYTEPDSGQLAAMDTHRRTFTANQRRFLRVRDRTCRTPWCDAPIRHCDHVVPHAGGGATSVGNGQGLCETCNHAKQAPGWHARADGAGLIITTSPTGHRYLSPLPRAPGSPVERQLRNVLAAA